MHAKQSLLDYGKREKMKRGKQLKAQQGLCNKRGLKSFSIYSENTLPFRRKITIRVIFQSILEHTRDLSRFLYQCMLNLGYDNFQEVRCSLNFVR